MLHDDAGRLVTVNYSLGCPSHRAHQPCGAPVAVPWVDFSQPAAANGWVDGLYKWVENRSVDGVALDGNPFDDEWIASVGGSPGILANVSSASKRTAFLAGLNASEAQLGKKIAAAGGVLSESSQRPIAHEWHAAQHRVPAAQSCCLSRVCVCLACLPVSACLSVYLALLSCSGEWGAQERRQRHAI
jgi:hypothetical protein